MMCGADNRAPLRLRRHDLDWRDIDDEIVALDGQSAVYLALDGSGALLWRLLAASTTRHDLIEALVSTYGIDASRAAADVEDFLSNLDERRLLSS
jgi:hypothetical protein